MDDSPWDENPNNESPRDAEWAKLSTNFTNAGYREGLTAGKEAALQAGFDQGFAEVGGPLGREIGQARGTASAMLSIVAMRGFGSEKEAEIREIADELARLPVSVEEQARTVEKVRELRARLAKISDGLC